MKIFTNNFRIQFSTKPAHKHFEFEKSDLDALVARLKKGTLRFEGEVFYVNVLPSRGFAQQIYQLQTAGFIGNCDAELILLFPDEEAKSAFLEAHIAKFKAQIAAGGLVGNRQDELLLIHRHGKWDLPKGKVERGEEIRDAAWREVAEETGLKQHAIVDKYCLTYHVFPGAGDKKWRFKTTHWFLMETEGRENPVPQTEEGISEIRWTPLSELRREIPQTYPQIMDLIRQLSARPHPFYAQTSQK